MRDESDNTTRKRAAVSACVVASVLLALAACSPGGDRAPAAGPSSTPAPASTATPATDEAQTCAQDPRTDEHDRRPRCGGMAAAPALRAYRVVGGSGDPVDQVVCDIEKTFVLDGKLFGVEFSGGLDGTYKFVRTPNIPGLNWKASGTYHIDLPDGPGAPGTLSVRAREATTRAGRVSDNNAGYTDTFTMTPVEDCK